MSGRQYLELLGDEQRVSILKLVDDLDENAVLDHLLVQPDVVTAWKASKELDLPPEDVEAALASLAAQGLVKQVRVTRSDTPPVSFDTWRVDVIGVKRELGELTLPRIGPRLRRSPLSGAERALS